MSISKSVSKTDDAKRIKYYWESHIQEGGGILHDILQDRILEDVDILWCLRQAMEDRDAQAIMICGFMLSISIEDDRRRLLNYVIGWPEGALTF